MSSNKYVVYILECADGTYYTGITNNLPARIAQHQAGTGAKYTRGRGPFILRFIEEGTGRSWALKREWEIKRMSRRAKWRLIEERGIKA